MKDGEIEVEKWAANHFDIFNRWCRYCHRRNGSSREHKSYSSTLYSEPIQKALKDYFMTENFDDRWTDEAIIDQEVLQFMRRQFN